MKKISYKHTFPHKKISVSRGSSPLILTVPHGGWMKVPGVKQRRNDTTATDDHLLVVAKNIAKELKRLGIKPYIITLNVSRRYVDVNRPPGKMAYECQAAEQIWSRYHDKIDDFVKKCQKKYGKCLLIDLHGQSHPENRIELGYGLKTDDLENLSKGILKKPSTVADSLDAKHVKELIIGPGSLGEILTQNGFPAAPRNGVIPRKNEGYYSGGYTVKKYCGGKTRGIQVEFNLIGARDSKKNINKLAFAFSASLAKFLN